MSGQTSEESAELRETNDAGEPFSIPATAVSAFEVASASAIDRVANPRRLRLS